MNRCEGRLSKSALLNNLDYLTSISEGAEIIFMVKANAYGHGLLEIGSIIKSRPEISLGVAALEEAQLLRMGRVKNPILLFDGGAFFKEPESLFIHDITPVISTERALLSVIRAAKCHKKPKNIHLKIDTGFMRHGFFYEDILGGSYQHLIDLIKDSPGINVEGLATHLCSADDPKSARTEQQQARFLQCISYLEHQGLNFKKLHISNSAAILRGLRLENLKGHYGIMVRPGLAAFGIDPLLSDHQKYLKPVLSIAAQVLAIKDLKAGQGIGYGHSYIAESARKVAIIAIGYGDGLRRSLSNRMHVLLRKQKAPIIGTISMDTTAIDITDIEIGSNPLSEDEEVLIIGQDGEHSISAQMLAHVDKSIVWETLTSITARLPRVITER